MKIKPFIILFLALAIDSTAQNITTIVAVGDIMLAHRIVPFVKNRGYTYPFMGTYHVLSKADIALGNLECPISDRGKGIQNKEFIFCAEPPMVDSLKFAGFDVLSLANNHILDFGERALFQTFELLEKNNIIYVGAGTNANHAKQMKVITKNGIKFGFLAFSKTYPIVYYATSKRAGTATVNNEELTKIVRKSKPLVDILVISFHWGGEYKSYVKSYQKSLARTAIANGADVVVGHHPHILQGIELYKNKPICYSLGNFAFGSYGKPPERKAEYSIILKVEFSGSKINRIILIPIDVYNYRVKFQPKILTGERSSKVIQKLKKLSKEFKTKISFENDIGIIHID